MTTTTGQTQTVGNRLFTIRLDAFNRECRAAGLTTQTDIARALRISRTTLHRAMKSGEAGGDFVVGALTVLHRARFDDLFQIPA